MLTLNNVSLAYKNGKASVSALADINFQIEEGKSYAIIGPSGCGKTSLIFLMMGLLHPTSGEIYLYGKPLLKPHRDTAMI